MLKPDLYPVLWWCVRGRGRNQGVARLVLNGCGIAVPEIFGFAMMRLHSYLCAPNRIYSLLIVNGRKNYCLREQTHSSELQIVFVNHSRQIVLDRQILRLCKKFRKVRSEFASIHKFTLFARLRRTVRLCVRGP